MGSIASVNFSPAKPMIDQVVEYSKSNNVLASFAMPRVTMVAVAILSALGAVIHAANAVVKVVPGTLNSAVRLVGKDLMGDEVTIPAVAKHIAKVVAHLFATVGSPLGILAPNAVVGLHNKMGLHNQAPVQTKWYQNGLAKAKNVAHAVLDKVGNNKVGHYLADHKKAAAVGTGLLAVAGAAYKFGLWNYVPSFDKCSFPLADKLSTCENGADVDGIGTATS